MRVDRRLFLFAPLLLTGILVVGCPGHLDDFGPFLDGGGGNADCTDVPNTIFKNQCALTNCHLGPMPMGGLDLTPVGVEGRVDGKVSTTMNCMGKVLADPAN